MFKKTCVFIFSVFMLLNLCGCFALIAGGAAGGVGTAVWLSGKMTQYVNASLERATAATRDALQSSSLKIVINETVSGRAVAQIRGRDAAGEKVYVDIHKIAEKRSRIEVRVGTVVSNKEAADRILKAITERLQLSSLANPRHLG